jgi:hypothetical protein
MERYLIQTLRSRRFALCVHAGFWLLLYLAASRFGGKAPVFRDATAVSTPAQSPVPVAKLAALFSPGVWPRTVVDTNLANLFYTRYFIPPPTPPPPPPTTRKIEITYLGFYQSDGPPHAMIKLAEEFIDRPAGAHVSTNWLIGDATYKTLTLTNLAAQTTLLPLSEKKEIEVPIQ